MVVSVNPELITASILLAAAIIALVRFSIILCWRGRYGWALIVGFFPTCYGVGLCISAMEHGVF